LIGAGDNERVHPCIVWKRRHFFCVRRARGIMFDGQVMFIYALGAIRELDHVEDRGAASFILLQACAWLRSQIVKLRKHLRREEGANSN
jgi:hypothetical protein